MRTRPAEKSLLMTSLGEVEVTRSQRRTLLIGITEALSVYVRAPHRTSDAQIRRFVREREDWVHAHKKHLQKRLEEAQALPPLSAQEIAELKKQARVMVTARVEKYAQALGLSYGRIAIRCQATRWGSCSGKGNLNFNCLLALVPDEVLDYVVVHELCHLKELNHSPRFWAQVKAAMPEYEGPKAWLKQNGGAILRRAHG